ncbi:hypothetical protein [Parenemella sanctibonifatiensis]|uniref:Secreted protein n=1 Tax=Parenemella sanctibonifatiensis TaxID=2016505 RepID=A0A255ED24_9ACTN|nr:hypothetical protein [Parenemella sanctibonifatiensis]OYN89454.1 hypothetical protein CGZ91_11220 [Parenemella sanctibonifatiensis]
MKQQYLRRGLVATGAALALTAASVIGVSSLTAGADSDRDIVVTSWGQLPTDAESKEQLSKQEQPAVQLSDGQRAFIYEQVEPAWQAAIRAAPQDLPEGYYYPSAEQMFSWVEPGSSFDDLFFLSHAVQVWKCAWIDQAVTAGTDASPSAKDLWTRLTETENSLVGGTGTTELNRDTASAAQAEGTSTLRYAHRSCGHGFIWKD